MFTDDTSDWGREMSGWYLADAPSYGYEWFVYLPNVDTRCWLVATKVTGNLTAHA